MGYLGNADPKLLFPDNVRDDLIPNPPQTLFNLSQEVPGGYEGNVFVFKRKHKFIKIVSDNDTMILDALGALTCNDQDTSNLLKSNIREGDFIRVSGSAVPQNNKIFQVGPIFYSSPTIGIQLLNTVIADSGSSLTIEISKDGFWEVLQPEVDYIITGTGPNLNKQIQLSETLNEEDVCYVVHKGSATYNFVPSAKSVGPEQLQENLRNFFVDRFEGDGVETVFELSQDPVNTKSIIVTVDGIVQDGDDVMELPPYEGEWFLDSNPPSGDPRPTSTNGNFLTFTNPPANGTQIRVLHLGFSSISRRAALSDGQVGAVPPASIGTTELANSSVTNSKLASNSVSTNNLQNNSVNGLKIRLNNDEDLRALLDNSNEVGILKVDTSNNTNLNSENEILLNVQDISTAKITSDKILPAKANVDLGDNTDPFRNLVLTGQINGVDINALQTLANTLQTQLNQLNSNRSVFQGLVPSGSTIAYSGNTAPAGWLFCNGQSVTVASFPELHTAIGYTYGGSGPNFNLPDLRQRFVVGKGDSGEASTLNSKGGPNVNGNSPSIGHFHNINHTHNASVTGSLPEHLHNSTGLTATTPPHEHGMKNHTHNIDHFHYVNPHFHTINSDAFTLRIPGAYGTGATIAPSSPSGPPFYGSAPPPNDLTIDSPRFLVASGGTPYDIILSSSVNAPGKVFTKRWFGSLSNSPSNPARTDVPPNQFGNGSIPLSISGADNVKTQRAHSIGSFPGSDFITNSSPPNDNITTSTPLVITVGGNTGNPTTLPSITSTGSTTSISSSNSDVESPPYITLNWIIKV
jgi:microcystin-dependent protein